MSGSTTAFAAFLLVAGATALWFLRAYQVRIPADRSGYVAAWCAGAALGAVALGQGAGLVGGLAAVLALLGGAALTGLVIVSGQQAGPDAVRVGAALPDFTATDEHDRPFALASLAGKPILLKFFRGHW